MQTFLPYSDFEQCAKVLDNKRLGKQRIECMQIYRALTDPTYGWQNHPAVLMWVHFVNSLSFYWKSILDEWSRRGFRNSIEIPRLNLLGISCDPPWLGDERLHSSHRSNLLRKDPQWYGQFGWTEPPDLPYYWPVRRSNGL